MNDEKRQKTEDRGYKGISNIEQGMSNVEGKEEKRMKKERKRMNM